MKNLTWVRPKFTKEKPTIQRENGKASSDYIISDCLHVH